MVIPSKQYRNYEKACEPYLSGIVDKPIDYPVTVKCEFYMPTHRRVDRTNLEEAVHDLLVKYGVIADDNRDIIASGDGTRVYYDKDVPRTEITITPFSEDGYEVWKKGGYDGKSQEV